VSSVKIFFCLLQKYYDSGNTTTVTPFLANIARNFSYISKRFALIICQVANVSLHVTSFIKHIKAEALARLRIYICTPTTRSYQLLSVARSRTFLNANLAMADSRCNSTTIFRAKALIIVSSTHKHAIKKYILDFLIFEYDYSEFQFCNSSGLQELYFLQEHYFLTRIQCRHTYYHTHTHTHTHARTQTYTIF
jgi:hypothetical protein